MGNIRKKQSGLSAKRSGEQFERLIEVSCDYYRKQGIANITKTPEPMRPIKAVNRHAGQYIAIFTQKAQPDFTGTLQGGRTLLMEAKHTSQTNIAFNRITDVQESYLNEHERLGAVCLVVISFNMKNFYTVPWKEWKEIRESIGKKSVNETDLSRFQTEFMQLRVKFLDKVDFNFDNEREKEKVE